MMILKRNGFLSYHLEKPKDPVHLVVPGERLVEITEAARLADEIVIDGEEIGQSNWETEVPPQEGIVIMHVDQYEASMLVPIKWEYSVPKLLSEFLSLKYLMMDIPESSAHQVARECARRMSCILNKSKTQWGYATP